MEESRKRKRGNEEAERSEQKSSDWVFDMAYIAWRDKLQQMPTLKTEDRQLPPNRCPVALLFKEEEV